MAEQSLKGSGDLTETVGCSCGAKTTIFYSRALRHFIADNPKWKYRKPEETRRGDRAGWYCGKEGHNPCEAKDH